jgi:hypothetical protein
VGSVKPLHITGRRTVVGTDSASGNFSLNSVPEDSVMDELGIVHGCEMVVSISDRMQSSMTMALTNRSESSTNDLSAVFFADDSKFADQLFSSLLELLDLLSSKNDATMEVDHLVPNTMTSTRQLIWDLLQSMPTNSLILSRVQSAIGKGAKMTQPSVEDAMEIDDSTVDDDNSWSEL